LKCAREKSASESLRCRRNAEVNSAPANSERLPREGDILEERGDSRVAVSEAEWKRMGKVGEAFA